MEDWFEGLPCALAAEHGCFLREAPGDEWQVLVPNLDMEWRDAVHQIMEYYTERTPGSFLEVKETALTWHFFDADPEFGQFQARELQNHLTSVMTTPHTVLVNVSKTVEARPESSNKKHLLRKFCRGRVLRREKSAYDEGRVFDFILCIGDDRSDAPMFEYLNRLRSATYVFTVIVQDKENSSAKHYLNNSNQLETSLQLLADLSSQTSSE